MYEERAYRNHAGSKFKLEITYHESDLYISTSQKIDSNFVRELVKKYYNQILAYVEKNSIFKSSLSPLEYDKEAPSIVKKMIESSKLTGIGPFSSVAGAIAQFVGEELLKKSSEVIVENGGDIFLNIFEDKRIGVFLGKDYPNSILTIRLKKKSLPFGAASSSSNFGHSLSFGKADLVTVIADDAIIADGFATTIANSIKQKEDVERVINSYNQKKFIKGLLIAFMGEIYLWGQIEIAS